MAIPVQNPQQTIVTKDYSLYALGMLYGTQPRKVSTMASIHLYFPDKELEKLRKLAEERELSLSEYVRECISIREQMPPKNPIEDDIRFIRRGLEAHWKSKMPDIYRVALETQ